LLQKQLKLYECTIDLLGDIMTIPVTTVAYECKLGPVLIC
jgi:hypothetical protein